MEPVLLKIAYTLGILSSGAFVSWLGFKAMDWSEFSDSALSDGALGEVAFFYGAFLGGIGMIGSILLSVSIWTKF